MKVTGVIAEFNPFHNGHAYFLQEARRLSGADYCVAVMSGDFVQRGVPAITDKYRRTRAALENGADLVLELPVLYASASAEGFAYGAVSILHRLGIIDSIVFGCETENLSLLLDAAEKLNEESPVFQSFLQSHIAKGISFPAARIMALRDCFPQKAGDYEKLLASPNNILAVEYLKALQKRNTSIRPIPLLRKNNGYHSRELTPPYASAEALRKIIFEAPSVRSKNTSDFHDLFASLEPFMPASALQSLITEDDRFLPVEEDLLSISLHYRLLSLSGKNCPLTDFLDVNQDLSNRILNRLPGYTTFTGFSNLCKTKDMTQARINRALLHIFLDIRKEDSALAAALDGAPYVRMLGCKKDAAPLLSAIKETASLSLISKPAQAQKVLSPEARRLWELDIHSAHLYQMLLTGAYQLPMIHEYQRPVCGLTD